MFRGKVRTIHFVGIGGIGMSGIAEVLLTLGFHVTGSDLKESGSVQRLRRLGAIIQIGHDEANVGEADVVVRSTAVKEESNPETVAAASLGIPVIRRAEMLAELMRLKYGIAVAGTHGKTTTTSMLATCLGKGGLDPTVVIGGRLDSLGGTNARLGSGDYLVAEADESDGTFLLLTPTVGLITNIDEEHMDHYGSAEVLERTFLEFANRVPFYGFSVLCQDHPTVQRLIPQVRRRVVTYGFARQADYRASNLRNKGMRCIFDVHRGENNLGEIRLAMPGRHNVCNAVGAVAVAMELNIPFSVVQEALHDFTGVQRRFSLLANVGDVMIVDDYGHHPVEIMATLGGAAEGFPDRRIIAVFQPHRYSRVRDLWAEFCASFNAAAKVVVCPIYPAGEKALSGIDHEHLAKEMKDRGHRGTTAVGGLEEAVEFLTQEVRPGDLVVTLGAGNVNQVCTALADKLSASEG
ncbi:MAG: UDP-N-acetylmuramate--L-alanine ligase [Proteobacteria bacterium]|nr:UDP-N-acetylmuramate--L-alanine ligase [Pseudomonadota bacterium]